jgi:hypothetical protein
LRPGRLCIVCAKCVNSTVPNMFRSRTTLAWHKAPKPLHCVPEAATALAASCLLALVLRRPQDEPADIAPSGQTFDFR